MKVCEEHNQKIWDQADCLEQKRLTKAMWWEKQLDQKLTDILAGWITQAEFEADLEVEESMEVEQSEVVGTTGGTQSSATEVDQEEEEEVVMVEEVK